MTNSQSGVAVEERIEKTDPHVYGEISTLIFDDKDQLFWAWTREALAEACNENGPAIIQFFVEKVFKVWFIVIHYIEENQSLTNYYISN